jgi:GTP-binding protein Era
MVSVIGKPNVGKSTFINLVVGHKVSIVSDKPQTTRRRAVGIATTDNWQIVFVDTPGMHEPHTAMGRLLNEAARSALADVDMVLVMVDASRMPGKEDKALAAILREEGVFERKTVILCLNKMDLLEARNVERNFNAFSELFPAKEVMMTSLIRKDNVDKLVSLVVSHLPEGEPMYDGDDYTDQPMRFLAAEFIREKALRLTREEVPHALAVQIESWEEEGPNRLAISAVILLEREGQKGILIGKGGAMLKKIGSEARKDIEDMTGQRVFLELFVKVRENWRGNMGILRELDYFAQ